MPSSWSNSFNSNKAKETSPQHSGWLDCFPSQSTEIMEWCVQTRLKSCPGRYLFLYPQKSLHLAPGGVNFTIKPIARACWENQDKQGLLPQEILAWVLAGLHPGDDSTKLLAIPEQSASASGARASPKSKGPLEYKKVKSGLPSLLEVVGVGRGQGSHRGERHGVRGELERVMWPFH